MLHSPCQILPFGKDSAQSRMNLRLPGLKPACGQQLLHRFVEIALQPQLCRLLVPVPQIQREIVPCLAEVGRRLNDLAKQANRAVQVACSDANRAQPVSSLGQFRLETQRLLILGYCVSDPSCSIVSQAQVKMRLGELFVQLNRFLKCGNRCLRHSRFAQDHSDVIVGDCVAWIELNGRTKLTQGSLQIFLPEVRDALLAMPLRGG